MRKMSMWLAMLAIIVSIFVTQSVRADVQYMETLTIGSSTTPAVGSSTVLADLEGKSYKYFRAVIQYLGVADMRYAITTGTASATNGVAVPNYGILVIDDLGDMEGMECVCRYDYNGELWHGNGAL